MNQQPILYYKRTYSQIVACIVILLSACSGEQLSEYTPKPSAFASVNQLMVIVEKNAWNGAVGENFVYHFGSAYPILPQPEPIFDITQATGKEFFGVKKQLRNILILGNVSDDNPTSNIIKQVIVGHSFSASVNLKMKPIDT